jgi:Rrf2 family protein
MWLSSTAQQAIHAVLCIAGTTGEGPVRVDEIAGALQCPRNYLSKTLHLLVRAGVLRSERGPKGGFQLAVPADRLTLARVVAPFEPVGQKRCLLGLATCGGANPCAAHDRWSRVAGRVDDFFAGTTIESLRRGTPAFARARDTTRSVRRPRLSNPRSAHGSRT